MLESLRVNTIYFMNIIFSRHLMNTYINFLNTFVFQTEAPSSPPQNVRARPVSAGTVVVHWDEPKVPNGVILVSAEHFSHSSNNLFY